MNHDVELGSPDFDYSSLGLGVEAATRLRASVDQIAMLGRTTTDQTFTIGQLLSEASELIMAQAAEAKHGEKAFAAWVSSQCGIARRHAANYMAVHRQLGIVRKRAVQAGIAPTVLFTLASAPPEILDRVLESAEQGRRLKVKDVKVLLREINPEAGETSVPLGQRGGPKGLQQLAQAKTRQAAAELTARLTGILASVQSALEPASRGRRVEKSKLADAILKPARIARRELIELTQCVRVPEHWDGTASWMTHEPLPDGGWSDLERLLDRIGHIESWPPATELVAWLKGVLLPALEWALGAGTVAEEAPQHAQTTVAGEPRSTRRKRSPQTAKDDAAVVVAA